MNLYPPRHGFHVWDIPNVISRNGAAFRAALLGADVVRVNLNLSQIAPSPGTYDWTSVDQLNDLVNFVRAYSPRKDFKVLPVIDVIPEWIPGKQAPGDYPNRFHYTNSTTGCEQLGNVIATVMLNLNRHFFGYPNAPAGGAADFIELNNEPNVKMTAGTMAAQQVPPAAHGQMAAYAMVAIDNCLAVNSVPEDARENKAVMIGGLDFLSSDLHIFGTPQYYLSQAYATMTFTLASLVPVSYIKQLADRVRVSCHPYPNIRHPNSFTAYDANTIVWNRYMSIAGLNMINNIWITEVSDSSYWMDSNSYSPPRIPSQNGLNAQASFLDWLFVSASFAAGGGAKLEGLIYWAFADDPAYDAIQFRDNGIVDRNQNEKPAADTVRTKWAAWN